ncbi:MAG: AgmX/PglI C-terminal domain-containing protein [bacterium]
MEQAFRKSLFRDWDRTFLATLFLSLFIEGVIVYIMASRPVVEFSERDIARVQERFANFVLGEPVRRGQEDASLVSTGQSVAPATEVKTDEEGGGEGGDTKTGGTGEGSGGGEGGGGSAKNRMAARVSAAEARRLSREAISQEVSNRGLLGLLTGTGTAAEGRAVSSLFSGSGKSGGVGEDLDKVLSSVSGLKTEGEPGSGLGGGSGSGGGVRGERSGNKATIDDLVSDLGTAGSQSLSRKGELIVESPAEVVGTGRRSIHRSPEAIQEVLQSHVPAIRYCYERELKRNPTLKGKVSVRVTVSPDGSVKEATIVSSTLDNDRVERCILARVLLWKDFPAIDPSEGDVTFRQVYVFGN